MFINRQASTDRSPWGDFWFQPVGAAGGAVRVTADTALAVSTFYACVRVLSESFAMLPFRLYRPKVGGGRQRVTDHWLHTLFCRRPNRWQTPFEFREMLQGHLSARGNAFCQIIEDGKGGISELLPLHPDRITLELVGDWGFRYRYKSRDGTETLFQPGEIWHIRGLSGDGFIGYNPIEIARESIGEAMQVQSYSSRFYANNATPPTWLKYPGKFADKAARQSFREQLQESQIGANRGKTMVLDQGMELNAIQINQKDMQFIDLRRLKREDVAQLFRMPPHKVGILDRSTNNNIEHQGIEFWSDTMSPWAERWESSIECNLLGPDTDIEVEYDMRAMMRGDSAARAQYIHNMVLDGVMSRNEGREMEGMDPIDGLDEFLVPVNEREISDPDPNDPNESEDSAGVKPNDAGAEARLAAIVRGNAARLARRMGGGSMPSAQIVAESLAVSEARASEWLACIPSSFSEEWAVESMVALAMKEVRV
jgi:HK97 family phage portal protein